MSDFSWLGPVDGDWSTSANWSGGVPDDSMAAVTIAATGTYAVAIAALESFSIASLELNDADVTLSVDGSLSANNGIDLAAGTITGSGTLTLTGGTLQVAAGSTFSLATLTIQDGLVTLASSFTDAGTFSVASGTLALGATTLTLTGSGSTFAGDVTGAGTLALAGGDQTLNVGASLDVSNLAVSGSDTLTVNTDVTYGGAFTLAVGTTLSIASGDTVTLTGTSTLAGSVTGAGSLAFQGTITLVGNTDINLGAGSSAIEPGRPSPAAINPAVGPHRPTIKIIGILVKGGGHGGVSLIVPRTTDSGIMGTIATDDSVSLILPETDNSGTISVQSGTLQFNGALINTNATAGAISISAGATLSINGSGSSNAGAFKVAAGGTLVVGYGNGFGSGTGVFSMTGGTFNNLGVLDVIRAFGDVGLLDFSKATIAHLGSAVSITGTLELGANSTTVAGSFVQGAGGLLDGTGTLTLTKATALGGNNDLTTPAGAPAVQTGTGRTVLEGPTTVTGYFALDGGRVLENKATLTWTGTAIGLGSNPLGTPLGGGTIQNDAGATFAIETAGVIGISPFLDASYGPMAFINKGSLIQSVTSGKTTITAALTNSGAVSVKTGTLAFASSFANTNASAASISVSAGATLTLNGGGSSNAGAFKVAAGGTLAFGAGNGFGVPDGYGGFSMTGGSFNNLGILDVTGFGNVGLVDLSKATIAHLGSAVSITSTLKLGANATTVAGSFVQGAYGLVDGTGVLTLTKATTLGGVLGSPAVQTGKGRTVLEGPTTVNGVFTLDGGRVLENKATLTWTTGLLIVLGSNPLGPTLGGGTIQNDAGATFAIQTAGVIGSYTGFSSQGTIAFINKGSLIQSVTTSTTTITATLANSGTVSVKTGTLTFDSSFANTNASAASISVSTGATLSINGGGSSNAGAFKVAAGGTLVFGVGVPDGYGGFSMTGGSFNNLGVLDVTGSGNVGLLDLSKATIAHLGSAVSITSTLKLGANSTTVAGSFAQGAYGIVDGTGTLTLTKATALGGVLGSPAVQTGKGRTVLEGPTTVTGVFMLDGGRVLENKATLTWTAGFTIDLGYNGFGATLGGGTIQNDAGATFAIQTGGVIGNYGGFPSQGTIAFINKGALIQSVTTSRTTIAVVLTNSGTVSVKTGTLDLADAVSGAGTINISGGAALQADAAVASTQKLAFGTGGGALILTDPSAFAASIAAFGAHDSIDLSGFGFSKLTKLSFTENAARTQGVLTIKDGTETAKLTLFGQYVASGFRNGHDSAAGTAITYVAPPASHVELAPGH